MNNYNLFFFIIEFLTHFVKIDSSLLTNSISIHFLGCFKIEVNFNFFIAVNHHLKLDLKDKGYIITESDALETFLGKHIHSQPSGIYLSQPGHLDKIFECTMTAGKEADTPYVGRIR
jgi:hypothetical protein